MYIKERYKKGSKHVIHRNRKGKIEMKEVNKNILSDNYTQIVVETDEENPTTIATLTKENIDVTDGYRVRMTPKYD